MTQYNGNPYLTYRLPGGDIEGGYTMMATAEDPQEDIWFIGSHESGAAMTVFRRQLNRDYDY